MEDIGIFVIGVLVTLLVATALALPLIGAVLDGRDARETKSRRLRAAWWRATPSSPPESRGSRATTNPN